MNWRELTCRACRQRYRACSCFTQAQYEQKLAERRARYAAARLVRAIAARAKVDLLAKRQRALELALAKVGLA